MFFFLFKDKVYLFLVCIIFSLIGIFYVAPLFLSNHFSQVVNFDVPKNNVVPKVVEFIPSYVDTPQEVKGVYMTSWTASSKALREPIVKLIDDTELNTLVVDIKDYTGKIFFPISDERLKSFGSEEVRVVDMQDFIEELHKKGIYVVGRIAVFQDAYFVKRRPDLAVKNKAGSSVWKDRKGISWIDAGSREYWDYIISIAKEARKIGFDEVNFDYIRFPSDGNMEDISFPWASSTPKSIVMKNFYKYLHDNLQDSGLKTSADLFGMTTTAKDDMGIGQVLENAFPYFDYISPMVYPSHYSAIFENVKNPEGHPYETIVVSMRSAIERADKYEQISSTTNPVSPDFHYKTKLRPWLQDFSLKVSYGAKEVRDQIRATNDVGLNSWLLWSASNKYTKSALEK